MTEPQTPRVRMTLPFPPYFLKKDRVCVIRKLRFGLVFFTFPYPKLKIILILFSFMDLFLAVVLMHSNSSPSTGLHVELFHTKPTRMHDAPSRTHGSGYRYLVLSLSSWGIWMREKQSLHLQQNQHVYSTDSWVSPSFSHSMRQKDQKKWLPCHPPSHPRGNKWMVACPYLLQHVWSNLQQNLISHSRSGDTGFRL